MAPVKTFRYFQSTSKNRDKALSFAKQHQGSLVKPAVLYEIQLKADGNGRDISNFSRYPNEEEVLLMPPTKIKIKSQAKVEQGIYVYEAEEL